MSIDTRSGKTDVSIVIPAFNEEKLIAQALESITEAMVHTKNSAELVVVDNCSTDRTPKIAEQFGATLLTEDRKGVGYARQRGLEQAKGEIIISTDADGTKVPREWITAHHHHYQDPAVVAVSGTYEFSEKIHPIMRGYFLGSKIWQHTLKIPMMYLRGMQNIDQFQYSFAGSNMSYRKSVGLEVGGYREGVNKGEDTDIGKRLFHAGKIIRDTSEQITILTSARRFVDRKRATADVRMRFEHFLRRYITGKTPQEIEEVPVGTMEDIR